MKNPLSTCPGLAALAATAGLLAGCTAAAGVTASGRPAVTVTPTPRSAAQLTVPTLGYEPTLAQTVTVARAVTMLASRCARSSGLHLPPRNLLMVAPISPATVLRIQVGWLSLASARRYGYYPPPSPEDRQLVSLARQAYAAGAMGPAAGCVAQAEHQLGGAGLLYRGQADTAAQVFRTAVLLMRRDPRVLAAVQRWRSCMRARGFRYSSPDAAQIDPRWAAEGTPAAEIARTRPVQLAVATADAQCRARLNYAGLRLGVLRAYLSRVLHRQASQLRQYRGRLATLVARAHAVLAGGQP